MTEPRFIFSLGTGEMGGALRRLLLPLRGYDIRGVEAYSLAGGLLRPTLSEGIEHGPVAFVPTGEHALDELTEKVRAYLEAAGLRLEESGDYLLDAANACARFEWDRRWPKRLGWIARRLHGLGPVRYTRT